MSEVQVQAQASDAEQPLDTFAAARKWIVENKLKSVGAFWATGVGLSMAYQWSRPIPFQLKLIHSRIWAQGLTVGAICLSGAVAQYDTWARSHESAKTPIRQ